MVWPSSTKWRYSGSRSSRSRRLSIMRTSRARKASNGWYHSRSQWVWETTTRVRVGSDVMAGRRTKAVHAPLARQIPSRKCRILRAAVVHAQDDTTQVHHAHQPSAEAGTGRITRKRRGVVRVILSAELLCGRKDVPSRRNLGAGQGWTDLR